MLFIVILFIILCYLIMEKKRHEKRLKGIPIRIHVNGTRGKSSTVRLISAALREAGIPTLAKTTGNNPMLIYLDGHGETLFRRGPSRIQEQVRFIKRASQMKAKAVVVECMALEPTLQFVSEARMIKSTIGVITNVRADHFEVMGKDLDEIAESLSHSIPYNGVLITADRHYFTYFQSEAAKKNTKAYLSEESEPEPIQSHQATLIFRENVAIATKVYQQLGFSFPPASSFVTKSILDEGFCRVLKVRDGKRVFYFVDAFPANDVDSTKIIQKMTRDEAKYPKPFVALLNNRSDRLLRMLSFASYLSREPAYDCIMLIGDLQWMARRYIYRKNKKESVMILKSRDPEKLLKEIYQRIPSYEFTVFGMGNYKGLGGKLSHLLKYKGES